MVSGTNCNFGGVVGRGSVEYCFNTSNDLMIDYCAYAGGVVGSGSAKNCFNLSNIVSSGIYASDTSYLRGKGGVVGSGSAINCYNIGDIIVNISGVSSSLYGDVGVGGVIGSGTARQCYNKGDVTATGLTGYWQNSDGIDIRYFACSGGIVGYGSAYDSYNLGNVTSEYCAGGIVGNAQNIANCYNVGEVTTTNKATDSWFINGSSYAGGIAGCVYNYKNAYIYNCANFGKIDSLTSGGIAGAFKGYKENSWGGGGTSLCYLYNSFWLDTLNISNSYGATINIGDYRYNPIYYEYDCGTCTVQNVKDINWYLDSANWHEDYPWDFENVWTFVEGMNDGYPVLRGFSTKITYNSNTQPEEVVSESFSVGVTIVLAEDGLFERTGYNIKSWNTMVDGSGVSYAPGATYTGSSVTLYAVWEAKIIPVSLNTNGGSGGTSTIYLKYDSGWYSSSSCTSSSSITSITKPTRTGFTFNGYNTVLNGTGTTLIDSTGKITASNTFYSTDSTKTIYAQWVANNPAKYDAEGGYWYIENGMMPQEKVTDSTLISNINSSSTIGSTYYFAGLSLQSKVYGGKEYCQYNGNWYEVMPIKWRLVYSSSQTTGYGTETATLAVMAEIVYADAFSENYIGANAGYSSESVTEFKKNQIDETFLVTETKSMLTFGSTTINGTPTSVSSNIFVASTDDLSSFTTSANGTEKRGSVKFSDLVKDYLQANGKNAFYYTRDLGTNYNNIFCLNSNGDGVQYKANNIFGVQFVIKVSEYACVG